MQIAANGPALGVPAPPDRSGRLPAPAPIYLIDSISILGHLSYPTTHHTPAHEGAADLPCLRQLPPPPKTNERKKGSDIENKGKETKGELTAQKGRSADLGTNEG